MQSGISVSQELTSEFNKFQADESLFALLVTISNETLTPVTTLPKSSPDFNRNLDSLQTHLQPNEALYVILRRSDNESNNSNHNQGTVTEPKLPALLSPSVIRIGLFLGGLHWWRGR